MATAEKRDAKKRAYTVREGMQVRVGVRISEKEQEELGLPTQKKSVVYNGGDKVELSEQDAAAMRHALDDPPELTDAELADAERRAEEMGTESPDRKALAEVIRSRQPSNLPDFGRIPQSRATELMVAANRRHEREMREGAGGPTKDRGTGNFKQVDSTAAAGGPPNAGRQPNPDKE
jgi:hypothetical protein